MAIMRQTERDRFLMLCGRLLESMSRKIALIPSEHRKAVPVHNAGVRFGDLLSETIAKNLLIHTVAAEHDATRLRRFHSYARAPSLAALRSDGNCIARAGAARRQRACRHRFHEQTSVEDSRFQGGVVDRCGFAVECLRHWALHLRNLGIYVRQFGATLADFVNFETCPVACSQDGRRARCFRSN